MTLQEVDATTFVVPGAPLEDFLKESHSHLFELFDLRENFLTEAQLKEFAALAVPLSKNVNLRALIQNEFDNSRLDASGYLVLDFADVVSDKLDLRDYLIMTAVCTIFGEPFGAFKRFGLWKPVGVTPEVDSWRAGGTGYNPHHIDFVNATTPPDYTSFYCVRQDPLGGGQSVISNHLKAFSGLTQKQKELALKPMIYEGKFFDLVGIGSELQPFPLYERRPDGSLTCRFTAKSLFVQGETDENYLSLISEVSDLLDQNSVCFQLRSKQFLIVDQRIACHGRLPLGESQADIAADRRRLLMQIFMRDKRA